MTSQEEVILNYILKNNLERAERRTLELFKQNPDLTIAAGNLQKEIAIIYSEVGLMKTVLYSLCSGQIDEIERLLSTKF